MNFFNDLWAGFKIFVSNFTAEYASTVNLILWVVLIAIIGIVVWRAVSFILRAARQTSAIETKETDKDIAERAAKSLSAAIKIPTISGNHDAIAIFKKLLRVRYPAVFEKMNAVDLAGGSLILRWRGSSENAPVLFCAHMDTVPVEGKHGAHLHLAEILRRTKFLGVGRLIVRV